MKLTFARERRCPACHATDFLQRTRRPVAYRLVFFLKSRAYHCYACGKSFVRLG